MVYISRNTNIGNISIDITNTYNILVYISRNIHTNIWNISIAFNLEFTQNRIRNWRFQISNTGSTDFFFKTMSYEIWRFRSQIRTRLEKMLGHKGLTDFWSFWAVRVWFSDESRFRSNPHFGEGCVFHRDGAQRWKGRRTLVEDLVVFF